MQEATAIIERVRRVAPALQRLDLALDRSQREVGIGQLFLARLTDSFDPYLRIPWLPVSRTENGVSIERPAQEPYTPGQLVSLLGPVGRALNLADNVRALLLVAQDVSPAGLLMAAQQVLDHGGAVALALIGAASRYPLDVLPPEIEVTRASDPAKWGDRDHLLTWADQVIAAASPLQDFEAYKVLYSHIQRVRIEPAHGYAYGAFHLAMPCGVGACSACLVHLGGSREVPACLEGPFLDLKEMA